MGSTKKGCLSFDIFLSVFVAVLGAATLVAWSKGLYSQTRFKFCVLYGDVSSISDPRTNSTLLKLEQTTAVACEYSMVSGGIILGGAVLLFLLDFVAWKGSQTYKGRAASIMAIFLSPICAAIALLAAVVVGYAQFKLCKDVTDTNVWSGTCQQFLGTDNFLGMIIGSSSAGLAGVLLIIYAISERIQMRRRDVDSMVDDVKVRPTKAPPRATKSDP